MVKPKIRVLLIEDNRFLRDGITRILIGHGGFAVDPVVDCDDSVGQITSLKVPDVVLLDLSLEAANTLKLIADLRRRFPNAKLVAMDIMPDDEDIAEFVRSGGSGFILKNASVDEYIRSIQAVASGVSVLPSTLTKSLFAQIAEAALRNHENYPIAATELTTREAEIARLIAQGMSNREIAERLHIATFTVKSHVHNILDKLELKSRLQIAAFIHRDRPK